MSTRSERPEPLVTPAEVASMFRVDPKTVTRWARAGKLSAIRTLGGHRRYRESEVLALLQRVVHETERFRVCYWVPDKASGRVAAVYGGGYEGRPAAASALRRAVQIGHAEAWLERWDADASQWERVVADGA